MGSTTWRRFLTKLRLVFVFFFFANAFFSSSLSSRAFFDAGIGSGMGMVDRGVVAISFPDRWMSSGGALRGRFGEAFGWCGVDGGFCSHLSGRLRLEDNH